MIEVGNIGVNGSKYPAYSIKKDDSIIGSVWLINGVFELSINPINLTSDGYLELMGALSKIFVELKSIC
jgi:hypothetical protein